MVPRFHGRILPVTHSIANRWGVLDGECQLRGTPLSTADGMIAATALEHDLRMTGATPMSAWERRGGFEFDRTIEPGGDRMETWPADGPGFSR